MSFVCGTLRAGLRPPLTWLDAWDETGPSVATLNSCPCGGAWPWWRGAAANVGPGFSHLGHRLIPFALVSPEDRNS